MKVFNNVYARTYCRLLHQHNCKHNHSNLFIIKPTRCTNFTNLFWVSYQNKFVKLVHLVSFIIKKCVTMHGHVNVKKTLNFKHNQELCTHKNIKQGMWKIFKQEFYRDLLHGCQQHSSFYTFNDMPIFNFKISTSFRITSTNCHINTVVPSDDGTGEVRNMKR